MRLPTHWKSLQHSSRPPGWFSGGKEGEESEANNGPGGEGRKEREGGKEGDGRVPPLLCLHYLTNGVCQYPCDCVRLTAASGRSECSCGNSSPEERCRTPTSRTGKWPTSCSPANGCSSLPTARTACKRSLILISAY